jgi:hypothetical protein
VLPLIFPFREERKDKGEAGTKEEETRPSRWFADPRLAWIWPATETHGWVSQAVGLLRLHRGS